MTNFVQELARTVRSIAVELRKDKMFQRGKRATNKYSVLELMILKELYVRKTLPEAMDNTSLLFLRQEGAVRLAYNFFGFPYYVITQKGIDVLKREVGTD